MRKAGMPMTGTNRMSRSQAEDDDGRRFSGTTPIAMTLTAYSMTITVTDATEATTLRSIRSHFPLRSGTHLRPPYRLPPPAFAHPRRGGPGLSHHVHEPRRGGPGREVRVRVRGR